MQKRQTELDILRLAALFFVVCLHVDSSEWGSTAVMSSEWLQMTFWRVTWAVPVFVMISGRFFLEPQKDITIGLLYKKYIKRILIAFFFWSMVYCLYYMINSYYSGENPLLSWKYYLVSIFTGAYHMWYLIMTIGLYMITPFLRKIAENKRLTEYFIVLFFISQIVRYFAVDIPVIGTLISPVIDKLHLYFVMGYTGYYLLGYYLFKYEISKRRELIIYITGGVLMVGSLIANIISAYITGQGAEYFTSYLAPTTIVFSLAIYTFFIKRISRIDFKESTKKFFAVTTKYGFGAYLVHALICELIITHMGLKITGFAPIVSIPLITVLITVISFVITIAISKIPVIGKYIV